MWWHIDYYDDTFTFLSAVALCSTAYRFCFIFHFIYKIRWYTFLTHLQYKKTRLYVSALQDPLCLSSRTAARHWARTAAWTSQSRDVWARRAVHVLLELGHQERVQGEGRGAPLNRWDREKQREWESSHLKKINLNKNISRIRELNDCVTIVSRPWLKYELKYHVYVSFSFTSFYFHFTRHQRSRHTESKLHFMCLHREYCFTDGHMAVIEVQIVVIVIGIFFVCVYSLVKSQKAKAVLESLICIRLCLSFA